MRWTVWTLGLLLLAVLLLVAHTIWFKPLKIGWFYERVFAEIMLENPELMSSLRMLPPWLDWYSDDLTDASPAYQARYARMVHNDLATLRHYDRASLTPANQLSYDMLEYYLAIEAEGERFQYHDYPLNQLNGVQNELPEFLATEHQVNSIGDAENYLARLDKFAVKFDQVLEGQRLRESRGIVPPTFVVKKVLSGMREFISTAPKQNILYTSFEDKLGELPGGTDDATRKQLLAKAADAIGDKVYPAYGKLIAYYEQVLPRTQGNRGVWALPDGDEFNAYAVRQHTTTEMTPGQVHALGLAEVARIETQMHAILQGLGLTEGSVAERMRMLGARPEQHYPENVADTRILADYQAIVDEIDAGLEPYFNVRPKAGVRVERIPAFREKTAPIARYRPPPLDGSRPGIFSVNLREPANIEKFFMRALAYHEAIPGHHLQIAIQREQTGVPTFRKVLPFTASYEGWALYAEQLAWEAGFLEDPQDNLGRLQGELIRAVRLVVDTGLHHKRWTREQAIDYMTDKTGTLEAVVVTEIEHYLVMPGQALAYKVGMNKILELRARAQTALGDRFDIKRFHDLVLLGGAMPMTLLETRVDDWIARERAR